MPTTLKKSRNKVFVALGDQADRLVSEAYDARRLNIDAALLAARVLHIEGGGMDLPLPEPCLWPPFATEAMGDETWVELTFAEVFSGPLEAGRSPPPPPDAPRRAGHFEVVVGRVGRHAAVLVYVQFGNSGLGLASTGLVPAKIRPSSRHSVTGRAVQRTGTPASAANP
ncbi:MAG: hypothetical protein H6702_18815 [Myxococcales bacterium]|nr:hypothetical protein [Myxococcales bacterium]